MGHSHGTLVLRSLPAGDYNLTLEAFNGFGVADRSPVVCPFRVLAEGEIVNQTQVRACVLVTLLVLFVVAVDRARCSAFVCIKQTSACRRALSRIPRRANPDTAGSVHFFFSSYFSVAELNI